MKRFLWMIGWTLKLAVVIAFVAWLEWLPGSVQISGPDYVIKTRLGAAILMLLLAMVLFAWIFYLWRRLVAWPDSFRQQRQWHKLQSGYQAIQRGLLAMYLQDYPTASRQAKEAVHLLPEHGLSHYLAAENARRAGDRETAYKHLQNLQKTKDGEALGLYGLLALALEDDQPAQALLYARQLHQVIGLTPYIAETLSNLEVQQGHLPQAEKILRQALQAKIGDTARWRTELADVLMRLSEDAIKRQDYTAALECAREALKWHPASVNAAQQTALLWQQRTYKRRAQKTILNAYTVNPHPDLVQVWLQLNGADKALDQISVVERLTRENPDHPVSALAMAEANRKAGLWGVARKHAMRAVDLNPSRDAYLLLAAIEDADTGDAAKIRHWQDLAAKA